MPLSNDPKKLVAITAKILAQLEEYKEKTGVGADKLLKEAKDIPDGLNPSRIQNWITGVSKKARRDHVDFVLEEWKKRPQYEFVEITDTIQTTLLAHQERTGIKPQALLRGTRKDRPKGLNAGKIQKWLKGTKGKVRKDHLDYVLALWEALPDEEEAYMPYDKTVRNTIREKIQATGLSIPTLLKIRKDIPKGLTIAMLNNWCSSSMSTKKIKRKHYEYVLKICEEYRTGNIDQAKIESRIGKVRLPISEAYLKSLKEEIDRTMRSPEYVLDRSDAPAKPAPNTVHRWVSGEVVTASQKEMDTVLSEYRKWPDCMAEPTGGFNRKPYPIRTEGYEVIKDKDIKRLRHYRNKTNLLPGFIFKKSENIPEYLTPAMVSGWIHGTIKSADPKHVQWVLKECKKLLWEALEK